MIEALRRHRPSSRALLLLLALIAASGCAKTSGGGRDDAPPASRVEAPLEEAPPATLLPAGLELPTSTVEAPVDDTLIGITVRDEAIFVGDRKSVALVERRTSGDDKVGGSHGLIIRALERDLRDEVEKQRVFARQTGVQLTPGVHLAADVETPVRTLVEVLQTTLAADLVTPHQPGDPIELWLYLDSIQPWQLVVAGGARLDESGRPAARPQHLGAHTLFIEHETALQPIEETYLQSRWHLVVSADGFGLVSGDGTMRPRGTPCSASSPYVTICLAAPEAEAALARYDWAALGQALDALAAERGAPGPLLVVADGDDLTVGTLVRTLDEVRARKHGDAVAFEPLVFGRVRQEDEVWEEEEEEAP